MAKDDRSETPRDGNRADRPDRAGSPGGRRGFSRRDLLRGGALGAVAGGLLPGGVGAGEESRLAAAQEGGLVGPGPIPMSFRINGEERRARLEPRITLLDALRNELGLTGAKKVCDQATCGSCSVLVGNRLVYACALLAVEAQSEEITTVEGLGTPAKLHPLQAAFVENDAQQCGFCTPGFVMACKAILDRHPRPDREEIVRGLGGNFCRCGTYAGIGSAFAALGAGAAEKG